MAFDNKAADVRIINTVRQILAEEGLQANHVEVVYDGSEQGPHAEPGFMFGMAVYPGDTEHLHCHAHNLAIAIQSFVPTPTDGTGALMLHFASDDTVKIGLVDISDFREIEDYGDDEDDHES